MVSFKFSERPCLKRCEGCLWENRDDFWPPLTQSTRAAVHACMSAHTWACTHFLKRKKLSTLHSWMLETSWGFVFCFCFLMLWNETMHLGSSVWWNELWVSLKKFTEDPIPLKVSLPSQKKTMFRVFTSLHSKQGSQPGFLNNSLSEWIRSSAILGSQVWD